MAPIVGDPGPSAAPSGAELLASAPILVVVPTLSRGGAERVCVDLAGGLADRGHDVHLAWAGGAAELQPTVSAAVTRHDLGAPRTAAALPRLRRLVTSLAPGVVLSALFHGNVLAAAATRGRRSRPLLVLTEHVELGALPRTAPRRLVRLSPRLVPVAYRAADAVVAVSAGVAADLRTVGHLPDRLVHHLPSPVDLDRIVRLAAQSPSHPWLAESPRPGPVVVALGRLVPVKGFDVLLRALAVLPRSTRLVVFGEGPERRRLEALAEVLGLRDRVSLPGSVANPYAEMARADAIVSSSRTEALPTVLIEAVHLRRPVVAADCAAGVREVLEDGALGRLVPPDDPTALAEAVGRSLTTGTPAAGPNAAARFSRDVAVGRYEDLLSDLLVASPRIRRPG